MDIRQMLILALVLLAAMGGWLFVSSSSIDPDNDLVEAAAAAMGGLEALRSIKTQVIVAAGQSFEPEQTYTPGAESVHVSDFRYTLTRELSSERLRLEWQRETFYPFVRTLQYTEVIDGTEGFRSEPQAPLASAHIAVRRKQANLSSPLHLVRVALEHPEAVQRQEDESFQGELHHVIALKDDGQLLRIYLDTETDLPAKVETREDDPIYGDTIFEVIFSDWRQVDEVRLPFELIYRVNGRVIQTEEREQISVNVELQTDTFTVPPELRQPFDSAAALWGKRAFQWFLRRIAMGTSSSAVQPLILTEVAPGVHHVTGGSHHSLIIEMEDHLIVVEAPLYEERSQAVLAEAQKRWPEKPVRYVVNTHFHNDHSGGLRAYVAVGATLITGAINEKYFEEVFRAPHSVHPDALQQHPRPVVVETVSESENKVLSAGQRSVEIYPVENSHVEGMLVVYLPQEKLLFVSDLFSPGSQRGGVGAKELLTAITQYGLQVEFIVGGHGRGVASLADLRTVVQQ